MITSITLTDPSRGLSFAVKPAAGIALQSLAVSGTVREDAEDDPNEDGTLDFSRYLGAATVALEVRLYEDTRASLDALAWFCAPWSRPWLTVADDEWDTPRRMLLRWESADHPLSFGTGRMRAAQYAWKAPRGVWEDTAAREFSILADQPDTTGLVMSSSGMAVTGAEGYVMPASTAQAATLVTCAGTARPRWKVRLYGPCAGPVLTRDDTGQSITFQEGWSIAAGAYVEITPAARSVLWQSDPALDRAVYLDYPSTDWWDLEPGATIPVRYHPAGGTSAGTRAVLSYTPLWIP